VSIGIKIANGRYYPILASQDASKKKLVLTTIHDNQSSVQIDLYKGEGKEISDSIYIGSLIIEDIPPAPAGEPEIELIVHIDEEGNLNAMAGDSTTGEHQNLSISLESLDSDSVYEIPDFELEDSMAPPLSPSEEKELTEHNESGGKKRPNILMLILFVLVAIIVLLGAAWLISQNIGRITEPQSTEQTEIPEPTPEPEPEVPVETAEEPEPEEAAPEPVQPEPTESETEVLGGVSHSIQWGDTLWDISLFYYRTPWLYQWLADQNKIPNPDLIYAGRSLEIPENSQN
jgi:hypothetical protein